MLIFIGELSLSTLKWVLMCQDLCQVIFLGFLHLYVLAKQHKGKCGMTGTYNIHEGDSSRNEWLNLTHMQWELSNGYQHDRVKLIFENLCAWIKWTASIIMVYVEHYMENWICFILCFQISSKKLKKYEKEYIAMKEHEMQQEDPIERYEVSRDLLLLKFSFVIHSSKLAVSIFYRHCLPVLLRMRICGWLLLTWIRGRVFKPGFQKCLFKTAIPKNLPVQI